MFSTKIYYKYTRGLHTKYYSEVHIYKRGESANKSINTKYILGPKNKNIIIDSNYNNNNNNNNKLQHSYTSKLQRNSDLIRITNHVSPIP
jgi:hypothetical protein